jgi:diguanylate cyclase (GGDEF)-like protein
LAQEDQSKTVYIDDQATPADARDRAATPPVARPAGALPEAEYWLSRGTQLTIGRAPDNDLCLAEQGVSQHHARVSATADGAILIEDLDSTNGTYVNGARITRHTLRDGDKVLIRPHYVLNFRFRAEPAPEPAKRNGADPARDALTGLYSRQSLLMRMDESFFLARKQNENLAVLMFEVDDFARIAQTHGPDAGDMVLGEVARVVGSVLGREDVFARYENHGFGLLLRHRNEATVAVLAQRIRRAVKSHEFLHHKQKIPVTVSIGIGLLTKNTKSPMDFLSEVLANLAKARRAGSDTINGSKNLRDIVGANSDQNVA